MMIKNSCAGVSIIMFAVIAANNTQKPVHIYNTLLTKF